MTSSNFEVNLSMKGYAKLKREIESLGPSGAKAMTLLEGSVRRPNQALRALDSSVARAGQGLRTFANNAGPVGEVLAGLGRGGLAAATGIGGITVALTSSIRVMSRSLQVYGEMTDQADALGLSFEKYQELLYGFGDVGLGAQQSTRAIARLNDSIGEILTRGEEAPKELRIAFESLGITMEDIQRHGTDLDTMLGMIADGIRGLGSQQERTAAAAALFGTRVGSTLLPILMRGSQGFDDMAAAAREAGAVLSNEFGAQMDQVADRAVQLDQAIDAQQTQLLSGLLPAWNTISEAYVEVLKGVNGLIKDFPELNGVITSQLTIVGAIAEAWRDAKQIWDSFNRPRSFYANRPGAAGELLDDRTTPSDDRGLVIDGITPSGYEPPITRPRPGRTSSKSTRKQSPLNAPVPTPRPTSEERYSYAGGTFGRAPTFDFSQPSPFALSSENDNFAITDEMISRLEDGTQAYDSLTESNNMWADAAAQTAGTLTGTFSGMFADMALGAETTSEEMIETLKRVVVQTLIAIAMQRALAAAMASTGGGAAVAPFALSGAAAAGGGGVGTAPVFTFHGGRGPGEYGAATPVPLSALADAPVFHSGRLAQNEMYAKITKDESVLTPAQLRAVGSPNVSISVEKSPGVDVEVGEPEMTPDGIFVKLKAAMTQEMRRQGTAMNSVARNPRRVNKR